MWAQSYDDYGTESSRIEDRMNVERKTPKEPDVAAARARDDTLLRKWEKPMERPSVSVLRECIELQNKKSQDYQGSTTSVQQADYYPSGIKTIYEIMHAKMLRAKSVMEQMEQGGSQNFESLEDTLKDLCNYASFGVAYLRSQVPGQDESRDVFNRQIFNSENTAPPMNSTAMFLAENLRSDVKVVGSERTLRGAMSGSTPVLEAVSGSGKTFDAVTYAANRQTVDTIKQTLSESAP